jgi:serine/threonine protein kinase
MRHTTNATTRTRQGSVRASREPLLQRDQEIGSSHTALRYRIDRLIGQGGYGQVYVARRLGRSRTVPDTLCVKVSRGIEAWIREAYFGQLLDGNPRAIAIYDAFVVMRDDGTPLYCLALEYARQGDLSAYLLRTRRGWTETIARREIAGILQVLGTLHRGQLLHRDLTPLNVFVCDSTRLKLGDFGIVRAQHNKRGITARTLNPLMAPSDIFAGAAPKWQTEVRKLPCSDHLKEIIYRCIGERRKRYDSADELIDALSHPPAALKSGALRTLKGAHLAFTGIFSRLRKDLARAAKKAGAKVHGMPSTRTTVVVRGRPNPLQAAGRDAGRKLMEIKRLRDKGHRIVLISEAQFWRLTAK